MGQMCNFFTIKYRLLLLYVSNRCVSLKMTYHYLSCDYFLLFIKVLCLYIIASVGVILYIVQFNMLSLK